MAVEPVEALQCPLFARPVEDEIAGRPQGAAQMVKPAEASRETLDTSNAWTPQSLVAAKGGRRIAGPGLDAGGKGDGVLDGESGALRQIRQHGMRGIAEKGDAAFAEAAQTGEAIERPAPPARRPFQQRFRILSPARETSEQSFGAACLVPALKLSAAFGDGDNIQVAAAADRVVHDMRARPEPEADHGRIEGGGKAVPGQERAPGARAREAQACLGHDERAHRRPQAVGADQAGALGLAAIPPSPPHTPPPPPPPPPVP